MKKHKKFIPILKILILAALLGISAINLKLSIDETLKDNASLVFIQDKPEENYILKKFAYITGAVIKPGVYELPQENIRLIELIGLAGGLAEEADSQYINSELNLSQIIKDSEHITIPYKSTAAVSGVEVGNKINLNTASLSELDSLPGIGESTAQKIIDSRPFSSIDQLKDVSGIGDAKFAKLKDLVSVN